MVKSFKESHAKDLEKLTTDHQRQSGQKATDDLVDSPNHTVLSMTGLTSVVWTLGMFQMETGDTEGPITVIWLMDFEQPQLTGVVKCELNTWEWDNLKVV
jgi:hypothetical protein